MRVVVLDEKAQRFAEEIILAVEMQVDDSLGQAGFAGDIGERKAAKALVRDAFDRRIDQLLAPALLRQRSSVQAFFGNSHQRELTDL